MSSDIVPNGFSMAATIIEDVQTILWLFYSSRMYLSNVQTARQSIRDAGARCHIWKRQTYWGRYFLYYALSVEVVYFIVLAHLNHFKAQNDWWGTIEIDARSPHVFEAFEPTDSNTQRLLLGLVDLIDYADADKEDVSNLLRVETIQSSL